MSGQKGCLAQSEEAASKSDLSRRRKLSPMMFTKRLRDGVRRGDITCSVRIWKSPHVKVGGRYPMEEGEIEVDSIEPIGFPDITPELARESGFLGVLDLLKVGGVGIWRAGCSGNGPGRSFRRCRVWLL